MLCTPKPNGFADLEKAISLGIYPTFSDKFICNQFRLPWFSFNLFQRFRAYGSNGRLLLDAQLLGTRCGIEAAGVELSNGRWVSISGSWSVDSFFVEPKTQNGTLEPGNPWTQPAVGLQSWVNVSFVILCVSFGFEFNFLSLLVQPQIAPWLVSGHEVWNWKVTLVKFACNPWARLKLSCEVLWVLNVCFSRTQILPFLLLCVMDSDGVFLTSDSCAKVQQWTSPITPRLEGNCPGKIRTDCEYWRHDCIIPHDGSMVLVYMLTLGVYWW